jgi:ABC transport system ATP-binding/permease protein
LESLLVDYQGTVLLVSHDRAFLNDVVTSTLAIEADGRVAELDGGYDDYLRQRPAQPPSEEKKASALARADSRPTAKPRKLSYKEKQELEALPARIEALESELRAMHEAMASPAYYKQDTSAIAQARATLAKRERELAETYERWAALELLAD